MKHYAIIVESDCTYPREYTGTSRNALEWANKVGRCESGETVNVYHNNKLLSRVKWFTEEGAYKYVTI